MNEEAHIGQELLDGHPLSEIDRKCLTIRQVVRDGDFSLDEALALYQVPKTDYESFIARTLLGELHAVFVATTDKERVTFYITVMARMYKDLLIDIDYDAPKILAHFDGLLEKIDQGKIAI